MTNSWASDREDRIRCTEARILQARPALESIIRPFAGLFRAKARLAGRLCAENLPVPDPGDGLPALRLEPFSPAVCRQASQAMLEAAAIAFPVLEDPLTRLAASLGRINWPGLFRSYLAAGPEALGTSPVSPELPEGLPADCLDLLVRLSLSSLLSAVFGGPGPEAAEAAAAGRRGDAGGSCPVCGFLPCISHLTRVPEDRSEFLKGGGGLKVFHCSLCGSRWPARRHLCPACGTGRPENLCYYQADKESGERVDACLKCGVYLPCIDLRKFPGIPDMETAAVGMVHLDIMAREKGFFPLAQVPWNRTE